MNDGGTDPMDAPIRPLTLADKLADIARDPEAKAEFDAAMASVAERYAADQQAAIERIYAAMNARGGA